MEFQSGGNILSVEDKMSCPRIEDAAMLFRDDNLDSALSPQDVDADIVHTLIKGEVDDRVANPEISNFDVLKK
jgi:hypothetical protein